MNKTHLLIFVMIAVMILSACGQTSSVPAQDSAPDNRPGGSAAEGAPRIASLSIHLTNDLIALGLTPVGSVVGGGLGTFLPHAEPYLKNTKPIGVAAEPDMEALLALKPDVIYVDREYAGDIAKYEKIAKTVVFDLDEGTWRERLKRVGELVGRKQQAEQFIEKNNAQTERVKQLIHDEIGDGTVMAVRITAKELRVFSMRRPIGPMLYEDLGLKPAKGIEQLNRERAYEVISQEVLPDFDADAIFVVVNNDDGAKKLFQQLQDSPIWQGLKAVKAGHVYPIPDQPWLDYSGLGHQLSLEHAESLFAK